MKALGIREVQQGYEVLKEALEKEGEVILTHQGKPFARVVPWTGESKRAQLARRSEELGEFRRSLPTQKLPSDIIVREDRDANG